MKRTLDGWATFLALVLLVALVYAAPAATPTSDDPGRTAEAGERA